MISQITWSDRKFDFTFPIGLFPCLLERLRGVPARLEEMTIPLLPAILTIRLNDTWSIQEHAGHFLDTEELWQIRLDDYLAGNDVLTKADLKHRKTSEANHNANSLDNILRKFRQERFVLTTRLEQLSEQDVARTSKHPRLNKPIRLIDSAYFTCEHDDHYLATLRDLIRKFS